MIDIQKLVEEPHLFEENCRKRGVPLSIDNVIKAYQNRNEALQELQELRSQQNQIAWHMQKEANLQARQMLVERGRELKERVAEAQKKLTLLEREFQEWVMKIPNRTHPQTPEGGEEDFRLVRSWGTPPAFSFVPKDHLQLSQQHDLIDFEMGAKVSGQKFYFLKNEAVFLELALLRYALSVAQSHRFRIVATPDLAKDSILEGIGYQPKGPESQVYRVEEHGLSLVGTSEITIGGAYADHIFEAKELPLMVAGLSHCFRTEAGASGRESKGLYRVHQFSKVELFVFSPAEESEAMHAALLAIEEEIFQALDLPYRVIEIASRDLGAPAYRKFDIEAWMPGRGPLGSYGEVTSCSNCLDFQARRLKIRYRRAEGEKPQWVHTLNGTGIATSRTMIALLERGQQADGTIELPPILYPYLPFQKIGSL